MPAIPFPLHRVASAKRWLAEAATATTSPFSGSQQVQFWGGRWWEFEIEMGLTKSADGRRLSLFFDQLGGVRGTFLFQDPSMRNPAAVGSPIVAGASQTGSSIATSGWLPDITVLEAGQFVSLGAGDDTRLHRITADVVSDGTGLATLQILPALRVSPADGQDIEIANPAVRLRLNGPVPTTMLPATKYRFSFKAREAL